VTERTPKYAPANEAGEKPYVVTVWRMGTERDRLVYAVSVPDARHVALGRHGVGEYVVRVRRALFGEAS
jgi:hypothetical protein